MYLTDLDIDFNQLLELADPTPPAEHPESTPPVDRPEPTPPGPRFTPSVRSDGWTAEKQKRFLEAIADGATVKSACRTVVMSEASAFAFRRRAAGQAFALGWSGANLVARDRVAERLFARALDGQEVSTTRPDGSVVVRHYHDNGLATRLLNRLDRYADAGVSGEAGRAARLVAAEFDAYLDMVGRDGGPARAALFMLARGGEGPDADLDPVLALARADRLARCGVALRDDVPVADLDPAARDRWTAEQWARAEAAGLIRFAGEPSGEVGSAPATQLTQLVQDEGESVWWCERDRRWLTTFPPPEPFWGTEEGKPGEQGYCRTLSDEEEELMEEPDRRAVAARVVSGAAERDRWFARLRAELEETGAGEGDERDTSKETGGGEASSVLDVERATPSELDAPVGRVGASSSHDGADPCTLRPARAFRGFQSDQQEPSMADTGNDVTVLNTLIKTVNDSIQGYQESAKDIGNQRLASLFQDRAMERQKIATMLQAEVGRLGGDPSDGGSILGSAHHIFLDMKSAITGKDDDAVLAEVQRGEEYLRDKFDAALAEADLGASTREVVSQAAQSVRQGADSVRGFSNAM